MWLKFEKPSLDTIAFFDSIVPLKEGGVEKRKMFGNPACFVNGNMFMAIHDNKLLLRLSEVDREKLTKLGGRIFEPMPGHFMKEYVVVHADLKTASGLASWVQSSLSYASGLPAKKKKK